jgi:hypothetical protein
MPMVMLKRRAGGQAFVEAQCRKGRERLRAEIEATETRQQGRRRK